ncbi:hypothetical protein ACLI4U_19010 (plasmid) [Natrialbaceae archaeon A-CW2]
MVDATLVFPVLAVVLLTLVVWWRHDDRVESAYNTFDYLRRLVGAILVILVAWTFLRSGNSYLFGLALVLIVFATVWFLVERPDRDLV